MLSLKKFLKSENIVPTSAPVRSGSLITLTAAWCGEITKRGATLQEGEVRVRVQEGRLLLLGQLPQRWHEVPLAIAAKHFTLYLGGERGELTRSVNLGAALYPQGVEWASLSEEEKAGWLDPEPRLKWCVTTERSFPRVGERDGEGGLVVESNVYPPERSTPWAKIECWYAVLA